MVLYGLDCKLFLSGKLFQYKPVIPFTIFMTVTGTKPLFFRPCRCPTLAVPLVNTGRVEGPHACNLPPGRKLPVVNAEGQRTFYDEGGCLSKDDERLPAERKLHMEIHDIQVLPDSDNCE